MWMLRSPKTRTHNYKNKITETFRQMYVFRSIVYIYIYKGGKWWTGLHAASFVDKRYYLAMNQMMKYIMWKILPSLQLELLQ